jgi:hypothetical protein
MTDKNSTISFYLPRTLQAALVRAANARGISRSALLTSLLEQELDLDGSSRSEAIDRQLFFCQLALDALLKHHPKAEVRSTVHATFKARRGETAYLSEEAGR